MKATIIFASGALAMFLSGLMLGACANTQIDTKIPANHPANPAAEAAVFVSPPNPFAMKALDAQPPGAPASTGDRPGHGDHPKHQEDVGHGHGVQTQKPQSVAPADSREKSTEHRH